MIKDPTHISDYPFWWRFADPAPDFLKHLKEEEIRVIIDGIAKLSCADSGLNAPDR